MAMNYSDLDGAQLGTRSAGNLEPSGTYGTNFSETNLDGIFDTKTVHPTSQNTNYNAFVGVALNPGTWPVNGFTNNMPMGQNNIQNTPDYHYGITQGNYNGNFAQPGYIGGQRHFNNVFQMFLREQYPCTHGDLWNGGTQFQGSGNSYNGTLSYQQQQSTAQPNAYAYDKHIQPGAIAPVQQINNVPTNRRTETNNSSSVDSRTVLRQPIHQAAGAGNVRGVELLLKADPKCSHVVGLDGITTCFLAAEKGSAKIIQRLLRHKVNVNAATNDKRTALHQAAQNGSLGKGHAEIVKFLIEKKADLNVASHKGRKPIHQAAQNGHVEVVKVLLAAGAEADEEDNDNITPLWSASQQGHHAIVKMLLETTGKKSNMEVASKDGSRRPIHQAAQNGHVEVVRLLLQHGARADPEKVTYDDKIPSPIWLAAQNGSVEVAKQLIDKGANVNFKIDPSKRAPLHQAAQNGHSEIARLLIDNKADLNSGEEDGWPPMMIAAQGGHVSIVNYFIAAGADIDAEEKDGATSLWIAAQRGHVDIVKELLSKGAKSFSTRSNQRRPIHQAAQNGHLEVVKLLVESDPTELNVEDKQGWRPLTFASQKVEPVFFEMMEFLVDKGAAVNGTK
ncbi:ankyrin repeat-containing domain protein [Amylocarpus encephaloides]|uniref:Ankyrin repeat-containing domain protein n=1 Tax=Amylocarpus encephaloides TaxID=45428 RepID=A0A9P7Y8U1_9HELO|nr:ankyrin repeat-containing domain protein [Amylocarpus encephaloides]